MWTVGLFTALAETCRKTMLDRFRLPHPCSQWTAVVSLRSKPEFYGCWAISRFKGLQY